NINYPNSMKFFTSNTRHFKSTRISLTAILLFLSFSTIQAQYTVGVGTGDQTFSTGTLGVSPFAMSNTDQRSQYIYYGVELQDQGAIAGYITAFALNITGLPDDDELFPENVTIKMKQTYDPVFGPALATGLTTVYTSSVENI